MTRRYPIKTQGLTRFPLFWPNRFPPGLGGESGRGKAQRSLGANAAGFPASDKEVEWRLNVTIHSFAEGDTDAEQSGSYS